MADMVKNFEVFRIPYFELCHFMPCHSATKPKGTNRPSLPTCYASGYNTQHWYCWYLPVNQYNFQRSRMKQSLKFSIPSTKFHKGLIAISFCEKFIRYLWNFKSLKNCKYTVKWKVELQNLSPCLLNAIGARAETNTVIFAWLRSVWIPREYLDMQWMISCINCF